MNKDNMLLMLASLCNGISFSMILPLLAPLIRQLKMTEVQAGLLVSASALLMSLTAMWISKRTNLQNQYFLLSIGFIGMTITWGLFAGVLSYGLTFSVSITTLFICLLITRASTGVFMAMPQIALQSYVMTNFVEEKKRSQMMAKFGALNSMGLVIGPFLTTLLIHFGILVPLWLAVMLLVVMSVIVIFLYQHEKYDHKSNENDEFIEKNKKGNSKYANQSKIKLKNSLNVSNLNEEHIEQHGILKATIVWLALGFSLYIAIVTLNLTAGFYIQDKFQFTIQQSAIYFSQCSLIVGVALVVMQVAISKWLHWSLQRLLWVGLWSMLIGLLISAFTAQIFIFQLAYLFYGIAVACLMPAFTTGASQSVAMKFQTKVAALCTMVQALSLVVAPLMSTGVYQINLAYPYYLLILIFIVLIIYFMLSNKQKIDQKTVA